MHGDDAPGYWALMFWHFHGLRDRELGRFIGELLRGRYDETTEDQPVEFADLLAQLEAAERREAEGEGRGADAGPEVNRKGLSPERRRG